MGPFAPSFAADLIVVDIAVSMYGLVGMVAMHVGIIVVVNIVDVEAVVVEVVFVDAVVVAVVGGDLEVDTVGWGRTLLVAPILVPVVFAVDLR